MRMPVVVASVLLLVAATSLRAEFVHFESGPVRPLALTPSRGLLLAANIPDNRVEIFRVTDAGLERLSEVLVGLEPVAIAVRGETEAWVVNHLSDSISVVDISDPARPFVRRTLGVGDEPRDIVVAGTDRDRVFVTTARRGQSRPADPALTTPGLGRADVWVFDADDLDAAPHLITLFTDTPRGLAVSSDGRRVYAAGFHSGNRTTALSFLAAAPDVLINGAIRDGFNAPGVPAPTANHAGIAAPPAGIIVQFDGTAWRDAAGRDWTRRVRFDLPDRDLFTIDATANPPREVAFATGVGTILFNIAVNPADGRVFVSNLESRNAVRFEPEVNGHIAENRVTIIDGASVTPVHLNPHIDYSSPSGPVAEREQSLAFPLAMEFSGDGETLFVAAFGSARVGVLDAGGAVVGRIAVGGGPSGLALDEARGRLYVLNRFDQTVSIVDTARAVEVDVVSLRFDPEPPAVREGRPLLYDARNSGHGDSACASCHIFGDFDSLSWDLGDPDGDVVDNPIERAEAQSGGDLQDFHPMKGPMATQSLRGMLGAGPMHWRGDRNGGRGDPFSEEKAFLEFRPAFQGLLGMGEDLPLSEMEKFRDFILSVRYPPNPVAELDGSLTAMQAAGREIFESSGSRTGLGGDGDECADCHTMPLGTDGHGSFELLPQDMKVAHLRNLYQKVGMFGYAVPNIVRDRLPGEGGTILETTPTPHRGNQVRGFGFLHDASIPTLFDFFRFPLLPAPFGPFTFLDQAGRSGPEKVRELEAFLFAFDTGLAPAVGQQVTLAAADLVAAPPRALDRYTLLRGRADAGVVDLVVHGRIDDEARGYFYVGAGAGGARSFQSDRRGAVVTEADLVAALEAGARLTVTAVPPSSGERIGIDRDSDGHLDGDERDAGSDPADPSSVPGGGRRFLRGNCNGDAVLDISDSIFLLLALFVELPDAFCEPPCEANGDRVVDISDAVWLLDYLFLGGPPPGRVPECETSLEDCVAGACR